MPTTIHHLVARSDFLRKAYEFAKRIHGTEIRKNGEPYFNHCLATAERLAKWGLDEATIAAGFLHDTPKSAGDKILKDIEYEFGKETTELVERVTAIGRIPYNGTEHKTENLRKFLLYTSHDVRVILIKLAARLNTMQSLYIYPEDVQKTIALKTMEIYAPVATQLGMYGVGRDLEDLAFPYLYPKDYASLMESVRERLEAREEYLRRLKPMITDELRANGVPVTRIESRAKHYFSLYQKLLKHDMDVDRIYDLVGMRVVVPDVSDCYGALGIIHKSWSPLPGRIKDYIAVPKPNGYQSLHTTVYTPEDKITEIQIRTEAMHQVAELGVAAYFVYRNAKGGKTQSVPSAQDLAFAEELRNFPRHMEDLEFFKKTVLAISPRGDVIDLPKGATPVDFAYKIHSDLGNQCAGAKVNGRIVQLSTALESGDVVEILTQKQKRPSETWLGFVKTSQAKEAIRGALKKRSPSLTRGNNKKNWVVKISAEDRPGLIPEIERVATGMKIKIHKLNLLQKQKSQVLQSVTIDCGESNPKHVQEFAEKLRGIKTIRKASVEIKRG